ncbi:MAG: ABC transporter ATP-binding protein [Gammaproteobacteria bacterium]
MEQKPKKENYIRIEGITKRYDRVTAVDNVNLSIRQGEIFSLMGSSGCGKSTLLQLLAGLETPTKGRILIDGEDMTEVPAHLRPVNMMFQSYALFPHMTVWQNIAFGLQQDKLNKAEIEQRVDEMLDIVRMSDYRHEKPHTLSGGQRQRVALARSLAKRPKLLLLDEPMGALDKNLRDRMQLEVVSILEKLGVTCLIVTHDQDEAMTMSERIAIMDKGEIIQIGTPKEVYEYPNCTFSAQFLGSVNIFKGIIAPDQDDITLIHVPDLQNDVALDRSLSLPEDLAVFVAVRPEKVSLSLEHPGVSHNVAKGYVRDIAYMGSHSIYHVILDSGKKLEANVYHSDRFISEPITWDDKIYVHFQPESAVVLQG